MMKFLSAFVLLVLLTGCQSHIGKGPITLSPTVQSHIAKAMEDSTVSYIAVSEDGQRVGWAYCPAGYASVCSGNNGAVVAINSCERSGKKCYIYANGKTVLWDKSAPASEGSYGSKLSSQPWKEFVLTVPGGGASDISGPITWNASQVYGEFAIESEDKGYRGCAGEITRRLSATTGRWQLYCASGQSYAGAVDFSDSKVLKGVGSSPTGETVKIGIE